MSWEILLEQPLRKGQLRLRREVQVASGRDLCYRPSLGANVQSTRSAWLFSKILDVYHVTISSARSACDIHNAIIRKILSIGKFHAEHLNPDTEIQRWHCCRTTWALGVVLIASGKESSLGKVETVVLTFLMDAFGIIGLGGDAHDASKSYNTERVVA